MLRLIIKEIASLLEFLKGVRFTLKVLLALLK